jgi:hypothetical protein
LYVFSESEDISESERCSQRQSEMAAEQPRGEAPEADAMLPCDAQELPLPQHGAAVEADALVPHGAEMLSQLAADSSARNALADQSETSDNGVNSPPGRNDCDNDRHENERSNPGRLVDGDIFRGSVEAVAEVKPQHEQQDKDSLLEDSDRQEDSMMSAEDAFQGKGFGISASEVPFGAGFS